MGILHITVDELKAKLGELLVVDIRDAESFACGNIHGSINLTGDNIGTFIDMTPHEIPIVIVCYHGISSLTFAKVLSENGFSSVYSLDGGMALWNQ